MKTLRRYFATEIYQSVLFVLVAFLALFAFFDMMSEVRFVGHGPYRIEHAFLYVSLGLPAYAYELMPIAALIGTIYVMAQFASRSEFTVMRTSSLSMADAIRLLLRVAVVFAIVTFVLGEFVAPRCSDFAQEFKRKVLGADISSGFHTGLWAKDVLRGDDGKSVVGSRFLNAKKIEMNGLLRDVRIYELDREMRMLALIKADEASFLRDGQWQLRNVKETRFTNTKPETEMNSLRPTVLQRVLDSSTMKSEITPAIMAVLVTDPDKMSALDLASFTRHLAENNQRTERYEIALWTKLFYPFTAFVMMALALPFAYMQVRSGGLSLKVFIGIMIGVSFQLINSLFSHIGLLNTWPPVVTAIMPSALFLLAAIMALWWVERH